MTPERRKRARAVTNAIAAILLGLSGGIVANGDGFAPALVLAAISLYLRWAVALSDEEARNGRDW